MWKEIKLEFPIESLDEFNHTHKDIQMEMIREGDYKPHSILIGKMVQCNEDDYSNPKKTLKNTKMMNEDDLIELKVSILKALKEIDIHADDIDIEIWTHITCG
jgi:hypothetical protein